MNFIPKLTLPDVTFLAIDSHTMGEPTRIILNGFPDLKGTSMMECKKFLEDNYDYYRRALMLEPRGHKNMFGAVITKPTIPEADLGVIFMDSGGYLNMCGHGSIGTATIAVESGLVPVKEPYTNVILDTPAGIVKTDVKVENGKAVEVSIYNVPAFLYKENVQIDIDGFNKFNVDIAFGGSFFALIDAEKLGIEISPKNLNLITHLGMKIIKIINNTIKVKHPYLDISTVDLAEFYGNPTNPKANLKNVVIFGESQVDRSPCGTGTSAKVATLYTKGKLDLGEEFIYESITGSLFKGVATKETLVDNYKSIIPKITGSAYITGMNTIILDKDDPLEYGFLL